MGCQWYGQRGLYLSVGDPFVRLGRRFCSNKKDDFDEVKTSGGYLINQTSTNNSGVIGAKYATCAIVLYRCVLDKHPLNFVNIGVKHKRRQGKTLSKHLLYFLFSFFFFHLSSASTGIIQWYGMAGMKRVMQ